MKLIIVVGMPASGKNIARQYAQAWGIPYFATGDLVRSELARLGASGPDETARVSDALRGADGMGVTRLALAAALQSTAPVAFLEGMRSWPEIELVRQNADVSVIAFLAPRQMRLERIALRGREDDSVSAFDDRDRRELDYGAAVPVALADHYVLNTGTHEDALDALHRIVCEFQLPSSSR